MTRCEPQRHRQKRGFAYLWMLMLLALAGLGLATAVEIDATALQRERERELLFVGHQFREAIRRYHDSRLVGGRREFPATLEDLLEDRRTPGATRHLRKIFIDPMTGKREWGLVRLGDRIVGVHSLSDRVPIKQDNFEPADAAFARRGKISEWIFVYTGASASRTLSQSGSTRPPELSPSRDAPALTPAPAPLATVRGNEVVGD